MMSFAHIISPRANTYHLVCQRIDVYAEAKMFRLHGIAALLDKTIIKKQVNLVPGRQ